MSWFYSLMSMAFITPLLVAVIHSSSQHFIRLNWKTSLLAGSPESGWEEWNRRSESQFLVRSSNVPESSRSNTLISLKVKSSIWALERGTSVVIANGVGSEYHALSKIMSGSKIGTFFSLAEQTGPSVEEQAMEGDSRICF